MGSVTKLRDIQRSHKCMAHSQEKQHTKETHSEITEFMELVEEDVNADTINMTHYSRGNRKNEHEVVRNKRLEKDSN